MDSQAIAKWAERQTASPAPTPAYRRLTHEQLVAMLDLRKLGKTQTEIAETLGCDQTSVSRALKQFTDSTDHASAYLRGNALRMAKNVVRKGQARDHIKALEGLGVLQSADNSVKIAIAVSLPGLPSQSEGHQNQAGNTPGSDN